MIKVTATRAQNQTHTARPAKKRKDTWRQAMSAQRKQRDWKLLKKRQGSTPNPIKHPEGGTTTTAAAATSIYSHPTATDARKDLCRVSPGTPPFERQLRVPVYKAEKTTLSAKATANCHFFQN